MRSYQDLAELQELVEQFNTNYANFAAAVKTYRDQLAPTLQQQLTSWFTSSSSMPSSSTPLVSNNALAKESTEKLDKWHTAALTEQFERVVSGNGYLLKILKHCQPNFDPTSTLKYLIAIYPNLIHSRDQLIELNKGASTTSIEFAKKAKALAAKKTAEINPLILKLTNNIPEAIEKPFSTPTTDELQKQLIDPLNVLVANEPKPKIHQQSEEAVQARFTLLMQQLKDSETTFKRFKAECESINWKALDSEIKSIEKSIEAQPIFYDLNQLNQQLTTAVSSFLDVEKHLSAPEKEQQLSIIEAIFAAALADLEQQSKTITATKNAVLGVSRKIPRKLENKNVALPDVTSAQELLLQYDKRIQRLTKQVKTVAFQRNAEHVSLLLNAFKCLVKEKTFIDLYKDTGAKVDHFNGWLNGFCDVEVEYLVASRYEKLFSVAIFSELFKDLMNNEMSQKHKLRVVKKAIHKNYPDAEYDGIYNQFCEGFGGLKARELLNKCREFLLAIRSDYTSAHNQCKELNAEAKKLQQKIANNNGLKLSTYLLANCASIPSAILASPDEEWFKLSQGSTTKIKEYMLLLEGVDTIFNKLDNSIERFQALNSIQPLNRTNDSAQYNQLIDKHNELLMQAKQIVSVAREIKMAHQKTVDTLYKTLNELNQQHQTSIDKAARDIDQLEDELNTIKKKMLSVTSDIDKHVEVDDLPFGNKVQPNPFNETGLTFDAVKKRWLDDKVVAFENWLASFKEFEERSNKLVRQAEERAASLMPNQQILLDVIHLSEKVQADSVEHQRLSSIHQKKKEDLQRNLSNMCKQQERQFLIAETVHMKLRIMQDNILKCLSAFDPESIVSRAKTKFHIENLLSLHSLSWSDLSVDYSTRLDLTTMRHLDDKSEFDLLSNSIFSYIQAYDATYPWGKEPFVDEEDYDRLPSLEEYQHFKKHYPQITDEEFISSVWGVEALYDEGNRFLMFDRDNQHALEKLLNALYTKQRTITKELSNRFTQEHIKISSSLQYAQVLLDKLTKDANTQLRVSARRDKEKLDALIATCTAAISSTPMHLTTDVKVYPLESWTEDYLVYYSGIIGKLNSRIHRLREYLNISLEPPVNRENCIATVSHYLNNRTNISDCLTPLKSSLCEKSQPISTLATVMADKVKLLPEYVRESSLYAEKIAALTLERNRLHGLFNKNLSMLHQYCMQIVSKEYFSAIQSEAGVNAGLLKELSVAAANIKRIQSSIHSALELSQASYELTLNDDIYSELFSSIDSILNALGVVSVIREDFINALNKLADDLAYDPPVKFAYHYFKANMSTLNEMPDLDKIPHEALRNALKKLKEKFNFNNGLFSDFEYFAACFREAFTNYFSNINTATRCESWRFYQEKIEVFNDIYLFLMQIVAKANKLHTLRLFDLTELNNELTQLKTWNDTHAETFLAAYAVYEKIIALDAMIENLKKEQALHQQVLELQTICEQLENDVAQKSTALQPYLLQIQEDIKFIVSLELKAKQRLGELIELDNNQKSVKDAIDALNTRQVGVTIEGAIFKRFHHAFLNHANVRKILTDLEQRAAKYENSQDKPDNKKAIEDFIQQLRTCNTNLADFYSIINNALASKQLPFKNVSLLTRTSIFSSERKPTKTYLLIENLKSELESLVINWHDIVLTEDLTKDLELRTAYLTDFSFLSKPITARPSDFIFAHHLEKFIALLNATETKRDKEFLKIKLHSIANNTDNDTEKLKALQKEIQDEYNTIINTKNGKGSRLGKMLNEYLIFLEEVLAPYTTSAILRPDS